jgi:hypothetical protein
LVQPLKNTLLETTRMKATYHDTHLAFLKDKIKEIKVAIFKPEMNSELHLPNNIIEVLKVDDDGVIYFFTSCTNDYANHLDRKFYGYLDFYRKGIEGRLMVSGSAEILEAGDEDLFAQSNFSKSTASRIVLVKLKMMQAELLESGIRQPKDSFIDKMKHAVNQWFFTPSNKVYDFS